MGKTLHEIAKLLTDSPRLGFSRSSPLPTREQEEDEMTRPGAMAHDPWGTHGGPRAKSWLLGPGRASFSTVSVRVGGFGQTLQLTAAALRGCRVQAQLAQLAAG